jgi:3-methyladenine DNA glycosylase AlkD
MPGALTAAQFIEQLDAQRSDAQAEKSARYFRSGAGEYGEGDVFVGVPFGKVFAQAKQFIAMAVPELERLLESPVHEARAGAASIMDKRARGNRLAEAERQELYDLYLRRHDRFNNWDLVDLAAPYVVGRHLRDKPRDVLYAFADSESVWERRTAIVATSWFVRQRQLDDTFAIAERLVHDPHDLIHKAVGGWVREAGRFDRARLLVFLERHAATMPRTMLRYAIEHLEPAQRTDYLGRRSAAG